MFVLECLDEVVSLILIKCGQSCKVFTKNGFVTPSMTGGLETRIKKQLNMV